MRLLDYFKHNGTVLDVDLKAPAAERWKSAAPQMAAAINAITEDVVVLVDEEIEALPGPRETIRNATTKPTWAHTKVATGDVAVWALAKALRHTTWLTGRLVGTVAAIFGQEYATELKSIARIAQVPYGHLLLGNLIYDLKQISEYWGPGACSSLSCNDDAGRPMLVRTMDWSWPDTVGQHTVLIRFHRGRDNYLSIGVAGLVGVLSALREGHWAVTLNQAPVAKLGIRYLQVPALQNLRNACDRMGTFRELVGRIQVYQTMSPFFAHAIGCRADEHVVVNGLGDGYSERRRNRRALVQANHFVGDGRQYNPSGILREYDTGDRYRLLNHRFRLGPPKELKAAWRMMAGQPITYEGTMQKMALCPANNQLLLRVRVAA